MSKVRASCKECGEAYYLTEKEVTLLPTMRPLTSLNKKPYLTSWPEWVDHIMHHCAECRFESPPIDCIKDRAKHAEIARKEKEEIDEQNRH